MNFFKNVLSIMVFLYIHSINAKPMGRATMQPQPTPTQTTIAKQPIVQQPPVRQPDSAKASSGAASVRPKESALRSFSEVGPIQEKSYRDLVNYVKNTPNAWDHVKGQLNPEFISTMIQKTRQLNLDKIQLQALLEATRDMHAIFSGDRALDINILDWVSDQIKEALAQR